MGRLEELAALGGLAVMAAACVVDDADHGIDPADVAHDGLGPGDVVRGASGLIVVAPEPGVRVTAIVDRVDGADVLVVDTLLDGTVIERAGSGDALVAPAAVGSPSSCDDDAFAKLGFRWPAAVPWAYGTTVDEVGISDAGGQRVFDRAMQNLATTYNPCGLADQVSATATYQGTTTRRPGVATAGGCAARDSINVMGFGDLPTGTLGTTCTWSSSGRAVESDVALNAADYAIYTSEPPGCTRGYSARAIATHEWGHVFGLGHVPEASHASLTMSTHLTACNDEPVSLGLGDVLGMRALY